MSPSEATVTHPVRNLAIVPQAPAGRRDMLAQGARDTKVDADAIHQQNGLNPSVCVRKAGGAFVGQLGKLRPIVNRPDPEGTPRVGTGQRR